MNLEKDVNRKINMRNKNRLLNLEFFSAIYGKSLPKDDLQRIKSNLGKHTKNRIIDLNFGEIGCALSHLSLYRHIIENKITISLILEDYVEILN